MEPVRLQLSNFLSYGEGVAPLELQQLSVTCLSGPNGHGKSALLDALTWALWGAARKAAERTVNLQGLLRLGATEMWVDLVFDHEGQRYRVHRTFRTSRGQRLDLFIRDDEEWRPLTLGSLTQTQARLTALLRMDYETFCQSAFLVQGRADEFTRQTPAKRKATLAEVLGLSRYERLHKLAHQERIELHQALAAAEARHEALGAEVEQTKDAPADLAAAQADREATAEALREAAGRVEALAQALAEDDRRERLLADLAERLRQSTAEADEVRADRSALDDAIERIEASLAGLPEAEQRAAELDRLDALRTELEAQMHHRASLLTERQRLAAAIDLAEADARSERRRLGDQIDGLEQRRKELAALLGRREQIRQRYEALLAAREQLARLDRAEADARAVDDRLTAAEKRLEAARTELRAAIEVQRRAAEQLGRQADGLAAAEQEAADAAAAVATAAQAARETAEAEQRQATLRAEFHGLKLRKQAAEAALADLAAHLDILNQGGGTCPVCHTELAGERLDRVRGDYDQRRQALDQELEAVRRLGVENRAERRELERRLAERQQAASRLTEAQGRLAQLEHRRDEARSAGEQLGVARMALAELEGRLRRDDYGGEEMAALQRLRAERQALDYDREQHADARRAVEAVRSAELDRERLDEAERLTAEAEARLPELRDQADRIDRALAQAELAAGERAALAETEAAIAAITVDERALAELDQQRTALREARTELDRLQRDRDRLPAERERLGRLDTRLEALDRSRRELERQRDAAAAERLDRPATELELAAAREAETGATAALDALRHRCGELEAIARRHERDAAALGELAAELSRLRRAARVAECVEEAFGRDGIPALIIENAVPEIERSANDILGRLTDYRMNLTIRLQRQTGSGELRETLDLDIADELGTRSYENYSGGEAFRINFALRLALSRLLAGRAGARLRTLIIDEGFGTQDEAGLDQLVEAIALIQSEFRLILVVTHLDSLKERFPSRIEVSKDPEAGSRFRLVGVPAEG